MEKLHFTYIGVTPLLMNNPEQTMGKEEELIRGKRKLDNPEEQAEKRRYLLPDGNFYVPSIAVRNGLLKAARGYTIKSPTGRRVSLWPTLSGSLQLLDPQFPLLDEIGNPIPGDKYVVNKQRVVIKNYGAFIRGRPEIFPWTLKCVLLLDTKRVALEILYRLEESGEKTGVMVDASQVVGLLDYRPEKSGWFGRFEVQDIWVE